MKSTVYCFILLAVYRLCYVCCDSEVLLHMALSMLERESVVYSTKNYPMRPISQIILR